MEDKNLLKISLTFVLILFLSFTLVSAGWFGNIFGRITGNSIKEGPVLELSSPEMEGLYLKQSGVTFPSCGDLNLTWCKSENPKSKGDGPFEFKWGDGNVTCSWFPAEHRYGEEGIFQVKVRVKNTCEVISEIVSEVEIREHLIVDLLTPELDEKKVIQSGVTFPSFGDLDLKWCKSENPKSKGDGPFEFKWGDGNVTCSWFPAEYEYNDFGNYTIKVRVKNTKGFISERSEKVEIINLDDFNWSSICNDGNYYEVTSNQRIYLDKRRQPTSFINTKNSIKLGLRNLETNKTSYSTHYYFETDKPEKLEIKGSIANLKVKTYENYVRSVNIIAPELLSCTNVKQPSSILLGDPFFGERTAIIYPGDMSPASVLGSSATITVKELVNEFEILRVTDVARNLQERLFNTKAYDGDVILMGISPPDCGGAGEMLYFGIECLINPYNEPHWAIIFHEMGHIGENSLGEIPDGIGGIYPNNRYYFSELDKQEVGNFMYAEGIATLGSLYVQKNILEYNEDYKFDEKVINGIREEFENIKEVYVSDLNEYILQGSNFSSINANILDGIFIYLAENKEINSFGWEIYPRFFSFFQDPLPSFIIGPLTELEGHTFFIAGLSAAAKNDLRFLFKDRWNFPINDSYFEEIYPILSEKIGDSFEPPINASCNGCILDNNCYQFGHRKDGKFCSDENSEFITQLEADSICENNWECNSNLCIDGKCVSSGVWQRFIKWFERLFGGN